MRYIARSTRNTEGVASRSATLERYLWPLIMNSSNLHLTCLPSQFVSAVITTFSEIVRAGFWECDFPSLSLPSTPNSHRYSSEASKLKLGFLLNDKHQQ
jgi:hypothetical protein